MGKAIRHGLGGLLNFGGRDARQAFWYYVLFVYICLVVVTMLVTVPLSLRAVFTGVQAGLAASQSGDPAASELAAQAAVTGSMTGMIEVLTWMTTASNLAMMGLLAAALVRRLHDSGLPGWWAAIPGAIQLVNTALAPSLMHRMMDTMLQADASDPMAGFRAMQGSMALASIGGWTAILIVIALGVRKSTPGPNRFGETAFVA